MNLPDVNVLVSAFRRDSPHHAACRKWLEAAVSGDAPFGVSRLALNALVRTTTNVRVFANPSTIAEAFGFCDDILSLPHCHTVAPAERHWEIFRQLCIETQTRGARVTDAWFAALAIESGCEWITLDGDFARFPRLRWQRPS